MVEWLINHIKIRWIRFIDWQYYGVIIKLLNELKHLRYEWKGKHRVG